jgi:predicted Zn finger-like uncharacterized protein
MSSADLATVIIVCPNCGTRYQVPYGTLGPSGRDVQCAQCSKSWRAKADAPPAVQDPAGDALFTPADEAALDTAFEAAAASQTQLARSAAPADPAYQRTLDEIRAAIAPKPAPNPLDPALLKKTESAFKERQKGIAARLPIARLRRTARLGAFVVLLSILVLGFALRTDLVSFFPQLAGLYSAIGLPVNVVGLQFEGSKTLTLLRDGKAIMQISARIRSVSNRTVTVPPILVSLLDAKGAPVYQWTVVPQAPSMDPGDIINFQTEMSAPPDGATTVRLTFTNSGSPITAPPSAKAP